LPIERSGRAYDRKPKEQALNADPAASRGLQTAPAHYNDKIIRTWKDG
jgi:hypothetical protein